MDLVSASDKEKMSKYQEKLTPYWRDKPSHACSGKTEWNTGKTWGQTMCFHSNKTTNQHLLDTSNEKGKRSGNYIKKEKEQALIILNDYQNKS